MARIVTARPLAGHRLQVRFSDGVEGIFPVEPERRGGGSGTSFAGGFARRHKKESVGIFNRQAAKAQGNHFLTTKEPSNQAGLCSFVPLLFNFPAGQRRNPSNEKRRGQMAAPL